MTIELARPAHMAIWANPDCPNWCRGGHGIPGEDHFHSEYVRADLVVGPEGPDEDWLQVGVHREEGATETLVFLHRNDSMLTNRGFALDLTLTEAQELIRELTAAVRLVAQEGTGGV